MTTYSGFTYGWQEQYAYAGVTPPHKVLERAAQECRWLSRLKLKIETRIALFRHREYYEWKDLNMPRKGTKNAKSNTANAYDYKQTKWANVPITVEDEPEIIERSENVQENLADLFAIFVGGGNVTLKRRPDGETVSVVVVFPAGSHGDTPVGLSAFAGDAGTAISAWLYKYFTIAGEDLSSYVSNRASGIG